MENTTENKAMFFAQYYGQRVTRSPLLSDKIPPGMSYPELALKPENKFYLELKPLSQITDEDAMQAIYIMDSSHYQRKSEDYKFIKRENESTSKPFLQVTSWDYRYMEQGRVYANFSIDGTVHVLKANRDETYLNYHDFLRSKGYALPFMGISVEQQIEWGWILLTNNTEPITGQ